ncbi:MAG: hypothetical protein N2645_13290 [Clostridia bacterium]|nr:hypothetical protein [Clostridia bacterium]
MKGFKCNRRPLSIFNSLRRNKRKVFSLSVSICVSITLIYLLQVIIDSMVYSFDLSYYNPSKAFSRIIPASPDQCIPQETIRQIEGHESTERVLPARVKRTTFSMILGYTEPPIYFLKHEDINYIIKKLDIKLISGRLPSMYSNDIIIDSRFAKNKKLKIGSKISHFSHYATKADSEYSSEEYTVVGILESNSIICIARGNEFLPSNALLEKGMLIFHKPDKLSQSNQLLSKFRNDALEISTYALEKESHENQIIGPRLFLNVVAFFLITVLTISLVSIITVLMFQKQEEFILLHAIGYNKIEIMKRAFLEVSLIVVTGLILSILLLSVLLLLLFTFYCKPDARPFVFLSYTGTLQALSIPLFVLLFSIIPIGRMINRIDSQQSTIEGSELL